MFKVVHLQTPMDRARFLVTIPPGIGDVVSVGLSALDQIIKNDPDAQGKVDILCNAQQAEILRYDPRINRLIIADAALFPTAGSGTFLRGVFLSEKLAPLILFLQNNKYTAVFPGIPAPAFYSRLRLPLMPPNLAELGKDLLALRTENRHISTIIRKVINAYFGDMLPPPGQDEEIKLFIHPDDIRRAQLLATDLRRRLAHIQGKNLLLIVAPDTSSDITRPPTELLADGIATALAQEQRLAVGILPGYTERYASTRLFNALSSHFPNRVEQLSCNLVPTLLATTALIDQADIFLSGDTGVMHLAVATKVLPKPADITPGNAVKIIVLFGGTHPGLYGYSTRTTILGRDRKEQKTLSPGIAKEFYDPREANLFDHIAPHQLTAAILQTIQRCQPIETTHE
jgi:ADP-heptose:LPS heptosyltransferase